MLTSQQMILNTFGEPVKYSYYLALMLIQVVNRHNDYALPSLVALPFYNCYLSLWTTAVALEQD